MQFRTPREARKPCLPELAIEARTTRFAVALVRAPAGRWVGQLGETQRPPVPRTTGDPSDPTPWAAQSDEQPPQPRFPLPRRSRAVPASRQFAAPDEGIPAPRAECLRPSRL